MNQTLFAACWRPFLFLDVTRFFVGEGPKPGPIVLDRSRVYILPTAQGVALGALVTAMVVGSLNFNNSLGLLLSFLLAGLGFVAILHTWANLAGLSIRLGRVEPAFAGESVRSSLRVENPGGRARFALHVRHAGASAFEVADVGETGSAIPIACPALRRGFQPLGRFTVETRFPLGLFRAWTHLEFERGALVYPRPAQTFPVPPTPRKSGTEEGTRGRGDDEFGGLRPYVVGDAPRTLHWKASARTDSLLVKQFERSRSGELWLDWNDVPDPDAEARLSRLCRGALDAHAAGHRWGLRLPGNELGPERGDTHLHRCLGALALFEPL